MKETYSKHKIDKFWKKVNKISDTDCWEWLGRTHYGYGGFSLYKYRYISAHRASWIINVGEIPYGMMVCHTCDNRKCVNPKHLFLGTCADNNLDKLLKGRQHHPTGSINGRAKLTESQVVEIREKYSGGNISYVKLADEYGVSDSLIQMIVRKQIWTHI